MNKIRNCENDDRLKVRELPTRIDNLTDIQSIETEIANIEPVQKIENRIRKCNSSIRKLEKEKSRLECEIIRKSKLATEHKIASIFKVFSPKERLSMEMGLRHNRIQVEWLLDSGYPAGTAGDLEHIARFQTEEDMEAFLKQVHALGFSLASKGYSPKKEEFKFRAVINSYDSVDIETIDGITVKLCKMLDEFNGRYYGWEPISYPSEYEHLRHGEDFKLRHSF